MIRKTATLGKTIIIIIVGVIIGVTIGKLEDNAEKRVDEYESRRDQHVLATWPEGSGAKEHSCEYGEEWCNPVYAQFLRERAK